MNNYIIDLLNIIDGLLVPGPRRRRYEIVYKAGIITGAGLVGFISLLIILYLL